MRACVCVCTQTYRGAREGQLLLGRLSRAIGSCNGSWAPCAAPSNLIKLQDLRTRASGNENHTLVGLQTHTHTHTHTRATYAHTYVTHNLRSYGCPARERECSNLFAVCTPGATPCVDAGCVAMAGARVRVLVPACPQVLTGCPICVYVCVCVCVCASVLFTHEVDHGGHQCGLLSAVLGGSRCHKGVRLANQRALGPVCVHSGTHTPRQMLAGHLCDTDSCLSVPLCVLVHARGRPYACVLCVCVRAHVQAALTLSQGVGECLELRGCCAKAGGEGEHEGIRVCNGVGVNNRVVSLQGRDVRVT